MRTVDPARWPRKAKRPAVPQEHGLGQVELTLRYSFLDALREYWANCSVRGLRSAFDNTLPYYERRRHGCVFAACLASALLAQAAVWRQVSRAPPLQFQRAQLAARRAPFPAVALCSSSVVRRRSLLQYAAALRTLTFLSRNSSYSQRYIAEQLVHFGALVTWDVPRVDLTFMQALTQADPGYSVARVMLLFSSPCSSMLRGCSWRGRVVPCHQIFSVRPTPLGFCCVFNSRYYPEDIDLPPQYLDMVGPEYGLAVIVHENPDDFAYIRRASTGIDVLVFDGSEYPLLESGAVRVYPAPAGSAQHLQLRLLEQQPRPGLRACRRGADNRSYSECLTHCRRYAMGVLCGCRLYTMLPDPQNEYPVCSFLELPCLNKHREKFLYYYPGAVAGAALQEEEQNGQECAECAPRCERRQYAADVSAVRYRHHHIQHKLFRRTITKDKIETNSSIIRLFYSSEHQKLLYIDANMRWYESLVVASSWWACMTGGTLVAASELGFHLTVRWRHHYVRRTRRRH